MDTARFNNLTIAFGLFGDIDIRAGPEYGNPQITDNYFGLQT